MALRKRSDNWIWKHVLKLDDPYVQCNINNCKKTYKIINKCESRAILMMKGHLYHEHGKYDEKDRLKWENDNDLIWRYFDKANLYTVSCKFCDNLLRQPYVPLIKSHLQNHRQEIRAAVQKEFADKSLSQYYKIDMKELNAQCKRCKDKMDIFYGTDALTHHIRECLKKYQRLKSGQKSEDNNVNRTTQQSTATENANTSSHHDNINSQPGNRENQQSDTSQDYVDVMAARERSNNWVWNYLLKLDDSTVQCNIDNCTITYNTVDRNKSRLVIMIKGHLYHEHGKYDEEDLLKWENDNDLIWRYFDKAGLYKEKCKFCNDSLFVSYTPSLMDHLRQYHRQKIRASVRKEIADKSLSQYFKIHEEEFSAWCKRCNYKMDIFYGTDDLTHHICLKMNQRLRSGQKPEDDNVNRMTQQSTVTENADTSSYHDNINSQPGNRENQQSDTSQDCVDVMAARERSNNWVWEHLLKLDDSTVQCNIDNCDKTYTTFDRNKGRLIIMIKGHLYHEHGKYDEEDRLKWENDNDLIWRYFDKVGLYKEKCKFCNDSLFISYTPSLRHHLRQYHRQKIRADILKEIADKSLSQYFKIHEKEFSARCKRCNVEKNIFYGTDALIHHMQKSRCVWYRDDLDDNNMNRITQESIADENTNSSSHHDNLNRQALGNREDQQSDTSRHCTDVMAALEGLNSWVWKHVLKLDNLTVQCNINDCAQTYINQTDKKLAIRMITMIKEHLYHKHEIWNEEDRLKWMNNNDLVWRYFDKVDLYKEKCKFCNISLYQAHIPFIKKHLQRHRQEIRTIVRKEIADKSLSQDFEIDEKEFSALCKHCNVKKNIFYGTDALTHTCLEKNQCLMSRQEEDIDDPENNDVNRMTQQSVATENAITSSHHDDIQDQQSNTGINNLRSHCQYHINENSRYEKEVADENAITSTHHDDVNRQTPRNQDQQRYEEGAVDENAITSSHRDDINRQAPRNQDQQSNTGINDLRSHCQYHINENSRYEGAADENAITSSHDDINRQAPRNQDQQKYEEGAADNSEYRMIQQDVAAENMVTCYHHESTYWHDLENQEGQQSSEENNMNNIVFLAHDVSDVNSHYDGTNWQGLGYQIDQQRMMHESIAAVNMATSYHDGNTYCSEENNTNNIVFLAHDVSDVSSHDGTNWQGLGYQIDQQSSEENNTNNIVFLGHDVSDISSHYDGTNWQGLGYQIDQQSSEENNTDNIVFLGHDVSDVSSHYNGTNWQGLEYQIDQQKYVDQQSSEGNNTNSIVFLAHNVSDVNSPHDGTNWQTLGYQVDQQRMMDQFVAAGNVTTNFHNDDTNWQAVGYLVDQQRMMHQFVATENVATSSHNDGTTLQALGNQENQ
ncbi:PREDICTED: uncharacterized protein LOC108764769 isoform X2 [Trachymyrmex cornetzi]|uniref:uncharacterized protein LOC108764769 isoform X2 n=1 Tax=Trachymyrmex cornetzi TaxID=471704 RepID=UPI00084EEA24|nr:PREDICTED: uncharacterized protein LOC108764769 isoform X2 [Trachymyrmex cornetzi]